jgi:hypothetical protein
MGVLNEKRCNIAVLDVLVVMICAWIISHLSGYPFWQVLGVLFLLGIIIHRIFCVPTTVDKWFRKYIF